MSQGDGIDMAHSGWTNPEGFQPKVRDNRPAPPVAPICGDQGPGGFECELLPGHAGVAHKADDGSPEGVVWKRQMVDFSALGGESLVTVEGPKVLVESADLEVIRELAERALKSDRASDWALALGKIVEMCDAR